VLRPITLFDAAAAKQLQYEMVDGIMRVTGAPAQQCELCVGCGQLKVRPVCLRARASTPYFGCGDGDKTGQEVSRCCRARAH
jgi:hypothetical protein